VSVVPAITVNGEVTTALLAGVQIVTEGFVLLNAHGADCAQEALPTNSGRSSTTSDATERKEKEPCKCFGNISVPWDREVQ